MPEKPDRPPQTRYGWAQLLRDVLKARQERLARAASRREYVTRAALEKMQAEVNAEFATWLVRMQTIAAEVEEMLETTDRYRKRVEQARRDIDRKKRQPDPAEDEGGDLAAGNIDQLAAQLLAKYPNPFGDKAGQ